MLLDAILKAQAIAARAQHGWARTLGFPPIPPLLLQFISLLAELFPLSSSPDAGFSYMERCGQCGNSDSDPAWGCAHGSSSFAVASARRTPDTGKTTSLQQQWTFQTTLRFCSPDHVTLASHMAALDQAFANHKQATKARQLAEQNLEKARDGLRSNQGQDCVLLRLPSSRPRQQRKLRHKKFRSNGRRHWTPTLCLLQCVRLLPSYTLAGAIFTNSCNKRGLR